jgi:hypothetical protein
MHLGTLDEELLIDSCFAIIEAYKLSLKRARTKQGKKGGWAILI